MIHTEQKCKIGDSLKLLKEHPSESIDTVVTSPPYWGLRDYGVDGQIGMEDTLEEYHDKLLEITAELKRVMKPSAVMFWNHGDSYGGSGGSGGDYGEGGLREGQPKVGKGGGGDKCMMMQNHRLVMRMIDEQGFILRNILNWNKCLSSSTPMFIRQNGVFKFVTLDILYHDHFNVEVLTQTQDMKHVWVKINDVVHNGRQRTYKATTVSGRSVVCTSNHVFAGKKSNPPVPKTSYRKMSLFPLSDLTTQHYLQVNTHILDDIGIDLGDEGDYNSGFVVGFYIAEGCKITTEYKEYVNSVYSKSARCRWGDRPRGKSDVGIQLSCGKLDISRGYIERIVDKFDCKQYIYGESLAIRSYDKAFLEFIDMYVTGRTCDTKHVTDECFNTSIEFLKGVVGGFLAGDGHLDDGGRWRVCIKPNDVLCEQIRLICRIVGYDFRSNPIHKTSDGVGGMHDVMTFQIRIDSQYRNVRNGIMTDRIESICENGLEDVYDIELAPLYTARCGRGATPKPTTNEKKAKYNNIYFLSNGIWTHNSNGMPSSAQDRFANKYEPVYMLVQQKHYWFDLGAVRVPAKYAEVWSRKGSGKDTPYDKNNPRSRYGQTRKEMKRSESAQKIYKPSGIRDPSAGDEAPNAFHPSGMKNPGDVVEMTKDEWLNHCTDIWNRFAEEPGDILKIPTQPHKNAHFAIFPTTLIEPLIKAACPPEICSKCGFIRKRIVDKKVLSPRIIDGDVNSSARYSDGEPKTGTRFGDVQRITTDWTTCDCEEPTWIAGTVLDPFAGSGTTGLVARKLNRNAVLFELNPEYGKIIEERTMANTPPLTAYFGGD